MLIMELVDALREAREEAPESPLADLLELAADCIDTLLDQLADAEDPAPPDNTTGVEERQLLLRAKQHGGSFLRLLAPAWLEADADNAHKLRRDFGHLLTRFALAPPVVEELFEDLGPDLDEHFPPEGP